MSAIKSTSTALYQLVSAEIKPSKDGKTSYVVADFVRAGLDKLMAAQETGIRLQILPKYGISEEAAQSYLQAWVDEAKTGTYTTNIGTYVVGDYEPFLRKDANDNWLTRKKDGEDKKIVFTDVTVYWFCDEDGNPIKGVSYITKHADNLFNNSTRIITVANYKKQEAAAKTAAKAANLVADAEGGDDDLL